jgi:cysteine desulfurase
MKAETAVIGLDLAGIAVSSGAACSSGKVAPSHVLSAMGVESDLLGGAIRVSFGYSTTDGDVELILNAWAKLRERLYKAGKAHEFAA